jgi:serine/threonine-protein kinase
MGVVVEALHTQLGQSVAIKVLSTELSHREEAIARFLREARAAAALHSDHVVRIYDVGTLEDGSPFMVMEFLRGEDLSSLLQSTGAFSIREAVEYVAQAADAIAEAHDHGVIHRDLKPSNLFVGWRSNGSPVVKVLDFGISKSLNPDVGLEGNLTATRTVMGSPFYMSPEQVRNSKKVDHRTDIWSLGMILQEFLTAEPVFKADTLPGICAAIVADLPTPLRELRPDASPDLEAVILRCLSKDPAGRYASVHELLDALAPFRQGTLPPRSGTSTKQAVPRARTGTSDSPTMMASHGQLALTPSSTENTPRSSTGTLSPQSRLPIQPTPFTGREEDLAQIGKLLNDPGCWLLTLTGPGGIGKTRLALQACRRTKLRVPRWSVLRVVRPRVVAVSRSRRAT